MQRLPGRASCPVQNLERLFMKKILSALVAIAFVSAAPAFAEETAPAPAPAAVPAPEAAPAAEAPKAEKKKMAKKHKKAKKAEKKMEKTEEAPAK